MFGPWEQLRQIPADQFAEKSRAIYEQLAQRPDSGDQNRLNRLVKDKLLAARNQRNRPKNGPMTASAD